MTGIDTIGMKDILNQFIDYCVDVIKRDEDGCYEILKQDEGWLRENLEQRISKRIYDKLYPRYPTYDDLALYFRLKTLDWIDYKLLNIEPVLRVDGMWEVAGKTLKQLEKMKTAGEKLQCIN